MHAFGKHSVEIAIYLLQGAWDDDGLFEDVRSPLQLSRLCHAALAGSSRPSDLQLSDGDRRRPGLDVVQMDVKSSIALRRLLFLEHLERFLRLGPVAASTGCGCSLLWLTTSSLKADAAVVPSQHDAEPRSFPDPQTAMRVPHTS